MRQNLAHLASESAVELDLYGRGKDYNLLPVCEFAKIIKSRLDDDFISGQDLALAEAMKKDNSKEIKTVSEFRLEMELLYYALSRIESLPQKQIEDLRNFCVEASKQIFAYEGSLQDRHYLVA